MQGHYNSPCLACGKVIDPQKHAKRKFYENMAKTSFFKLIVVVIWSVTPIFYFLYLFSSLKKSSKNTQRRDSYKIIGAQVEM